MGGGRPATNEKKKEKNDQKRHGNQRLSSLFLVFGPIPSSGFLPHLPGPNKAQNDKGGRVTVFHRIPAPYDASGAANPPQSAVGSRRITNSMWSSSSSRQNSISVI